MYHNFAYDGVVKSTLHTIYPVPNHCALPNEMTEFPLNCVYYTRATVLTDIISPKYPCMRCKIGFTGEITVLSVAASFPSDTFSSCSVEIPSCDNTYTEFLGADIRYDVNSISDTSFLIQKYFSCVKCTDNLIPVVTLFHDTTLKTFYYKSHDDTTFDKATITTKGNSMACRDPLLSQSFGLADNDTNFDLDANCGLAVIDLSQAKIPGTKTETR